MDNEMIERCELAVNELQDTGKLVKQVVIEVIKAMREPTEKMLALGPEVQCWPEMIDAIIGEEEI